MKDLKQLKTIFFLSLITLFTSCSLLQRATYSYSETESGLKYLIIKPGEGESPKRGDIVIIHYKAMLEDETVFENSRNKRTPVSFRIGNEQFIEGLQEGIMLMNKGAVGRFVIPPELAYGENRVGVVEPNSTLIYEVELLDIKPGIEIVTPEKKEIEKVKTDSGLEYSIISQGKGSRAFDGMFIAAEYTGFFGDNEIFDSSFDRGKPLEVKLGDGTLIQGLEEGFTYLHEGDKARFWIPSELAYGKRGRGIIPPDTDLVFDIELLKVKPAVKPLPYNVNDKDTLETGSGLQYIIVKEGYGLQPMPGQLVKVHYSAYLTNGYMFDSSVQRSQPFNIVAGKGLMIKGWEEGIMLMNKGAKYRFIMPYNLAFGSKSFGDVPAYSTVIFDIELIDIE